MKYLLTVAVLLMGTGWANAQKYYVKVDSLNYVKFVSGKKYKVSDDAGNIKELTLKKIEGDSFYFETTSMHYSELRSLKNPKRKAVLDVISYPATVGSCLGMSAFPIIYARGYFTSDADGMLNALAIFIGETIVFAASRNYLSKNKKWLDLSKLKQLEVTNR